jgi:cyclophilin family peptidyl-prolyl cis-trans isomerase
VHPNPFVRVYAARSAGTVKDVTTLRALLEDTDANVRTATFEALSNVEGRTSDPVLISALGSANDAQLLITVARLLEGTSLQSEALATALGTLGRLSLTHAETLRDARMALLGLIERVGGEAAAPLVRPYLVDFDPVVAGRAAEVLTGWTGGTFTAAPRPAIRLGLPTPAELRAIEATEVVLHMERGGAIEITLLPFVATTNAYRLFHLVRSGALNGLTFHRVVPNFVAQGGSPGANEYAGHGAFTRDEVGLPVQWRGTVGLSTRGRDTGDGQIYVNLADNSWLDHDYTVLGFVSAGMEVVDAVLEGDVIERAEVRSEAPATPRP